MFVQALSTYEEGLVLIDKALNITIECPRNPDLNWEKACIMLQKMKKTRSVIINNIIILLLFHGVPKSGGLLFIIVLIVT